MEPVNSVISEKSKIFQDTYIRDSRIADHAIISDRAVIISSSIEVHASIGRECSVIYSKFGFGTFIGRGSIVKFSKIGKFGNLSWHLSIGGSNHNYNAACMYTDSTWKRVLNVGSGLKPVPDEEYTVIGNDVWIGANADIIRGVKIGDGAVIGADSLVLQDIPPYAIAVGSPAKVIRYRFDEQTRIRLLSIRWWDWDIETIRSAADYLRGDLDMNKLLHLEQIAAERKLEI